MKRIKQIASNFKFKLKCWIDYILNYENPHLDNEKCIYLIGTPEYGNLGDHLIAFAELKMLEDCFGKEKVAEVTENNIRYDFARLKSKINEKSYFFLQGGGNISDVWSDQEKLREKVFSEFLNRKMMVFPQTVYITDDSSVDKILEKYSNNILVCAREQYTYKLLKDCGKNVILCPDAALYLWEYCSRYRDTIHIREGIGICLRGDSESVLEENDKKYIFEYAVELDGKSSCFNTVKNDAIYIRNREGELKKILTQISGYKLVITDRLHAMIMAYLVGTPCIAFPNSNRKIQGCYEWIANAENIYFATDVKEGLEQIEGLIGRYNTNQFEFMDYYDKIIESYRDFD